MICLCFHSNLSLSACSSIDRDVCLFISPRLSNFCQSTHQSVYVLICLLLWQVSIEKAIIIYQYSRPERRKHFLDLATADGSGPQSWQLSVFRFPLVLPPGAESWLIQEQESVLWFFDPVTTGLCKTIPATQFSQLKCLVFCFSAICLVLTWNILWRLLWCV